ncbi:hypothetical protein HK102_000612, partial [Quaeritorhiza haematococci]
ELEQKIPRPKNQKHVRVDPRTVVEINGKRAATGSKGTYIFKENGLIKKTVSIVLEGVQQHLVCYFTKEDVARGKLVPPRYVSELANQKIPTDLILDQNFRKPPLPPAIQSQMEHLQQQKQQLFRKGSTSPGDAVGTPDLLLHHTDDANNGGNDIGSLLLQGQDALSASLFLLSSSAADNEEMGFDYDWVGEEVDYDVANNAVETDTVNGESDLDYLQALSSLRNQNDSTIPYLHPSNIPAIGQTLFANDDPQPPSSTVDDLCSVLNFSGGDNMSSSYFGSPASTTAGWSDQVHTPRSRFGSTASSITLPLSDYHQNTSDREFTNMHRFLGFDSFDQSTVQTSLIGTTEVSSSTPFTTPLISSQIPPVSSMPSQSGMGATLPLLDPTHSAHDQYADATPLLHNVVSTNLHNHASFNIGLSESDVLGNMRATIDDIAFPELNASNAMPMTQIDFDTLPAVSMGNESTKAIDFGVPNQQDQRRSSRVKSRSPLSRKRTNSFGLLLTSFPYHYTPRQPYTSSAAATNTTATTGTAGFLSASQPYSTGMQTSDKMQRNARTDSGFYEVDTDCHLIAGAVANPTASSLSTQNMIQTRQPADDTVANVKMGTNHLPIDVGLFFESDQQLHNQQNSGASCAAGFYAASSHNLHNSVLEQDFLHGAVGGSEANGQKQADHSRWPSSSSSSSTFVIAPDRLATPTPPYDDVADPLTPISVTPMPHSANVGDFSNNRPQDEVGSRGIMQMMGPTEDHDLALAIHTMLNGHGAYDQPKHLIGEPAAVNTASLAPFPPHRVAQNRVQDRFLDNPSDQIPLDLTCFTAVTSA